jgi:glycosyltransferase involved in cell wall biosynthesis
MTDGVADPFGRHCGIKGSSVNDSSLVSIIIPSFNQGRFIAKTLDSVLAQDYRPLDVVVVDGASTDETIAVLHRYDSAPEVRWVSAPDRGVVDAVNKGFNLARGELAAIQSSDDYYLPGAISAAVAALQADPSLGFVFGDILKVDVEGREVSRTQLAPFSLENVLAMRTWIPQPSTFFRLALARELGGWRESVPYAADTDLWLRMAFRCDARKIDQVMAGRRIHADQRDRHGDRIFRDYTRTLEDLEPLQRAAARLRRAAAAGRLRMLARYQPQQGYWQRWSKHVCATWLDRQSWKQTDPMSLVPGWYPLRARIAALFRIRR